MTKIPSLNLRIANRTRPTTIAQPNPRDSAPRIQIPPSFRGSLRLLNWKLILLRCALATATVAMILIIAILASLALGGLGVTASTRPNIVFIMTDDQDRRLNSLAHMPFLQSELVAKGTEFTNHYTNQALCCPSRSTLLRGQTVRKYHPFNLLRYGNNDLTLRQYQLDQCISAWVCTSRMTSVETPSRIQELIQSIKRGSYNKWVLSGQDNNYLPHWLNAAGYRTECELNENLEQLRGSSHLTRYRQDHERLWFVQLRRQIEGLGLE